MGLWQSTPVDPKEFCPKNGYVWGSFDSLMADFRGSSPYPIPVGGDGDGGEGSEGAGSDGGGGGGGGGAGNLPQMDDLYASYSRALAAQRLQARYEEPTSNYPALSTSVGAAIREAAGEFAAPPYYVPGGQDDSNFPPSINVQSPIYPSWIRASDQ